MMTDSGIIRCQHCNMTFRSLDLLERHKEKFCIGSEIGDPSVLQQRVNLSLDKGEEYKENTLDMGAGREPQRSEVFDDMLQQQRLRKARMRQLVPDFLTEREMNLLKGYEPGVSLSHSQSLRQLTNEFQKLRMSIEESFPNTGSLQTEGEDLQPNRGMEYRKRMHQMVAAHERHLADIQARNRDLEQQREEIRRRLAEYASRDKSTTHIEQMLLELKAQEEKNQMALDSLREQIEFLQLDVGSKSEAGVMAHSSYPTEEKEEHAQFNFIPFTTGNGSLASEISALRLAYLQNGGKDPVILSQMHDLQSEAQTLEITTQKPERKEKKKKAELPHQTLDTELLRVELENQRLEDEILKLKLQRETRKVGDDYRDKELMDIQREHMKQMAEMQAEMEILKQEASRMRLRKGRWSPQPQRPPPPPPLPPPVSPHHHPTILPPPPPPGGQYVPPFIPGVMERIQPNAQTMSKHFLNPLDALGPSPYDPAAGFVIFFDFVLGLDPTVSLVRLVAGLYSNGQELGKPTPLPAVYCEMGRTMQYLTDAYKGNIAMLSSRQPVPRVRPFPSICLVLDLQAAGGFDSYGQEMRRLVSRGWAKIDIFDHNNQVISGRWKVPVRALPVQPILSMGQLNGIPQVGNAEIYLRIVNARDADIQSMANIDPSDASLYSYPPMVTGHVLHPVDNVPPQRPLYRAPANQYVSIPHYTEYVDPPPVQEHPDAGKNNQRTAKVAAQSKKTEKTEPHKPPPASLKLVDDSEKSVGFMVDRVKDAPSGDGSLRLTGYHQRTGMVINTRNSGMVCSTTPVKSNIKQGYFIFGEQEITFHDVVPSEDMILIIRFYNWPDTCTRNTPWDEGSSLQTLSESEEWVVAWATCRLTKPVMKNNVKKEGQTVTWNTGTHTLPFFHCPVPAVFNLSILPGEHYYDIYEPYGSADVRIHIFSGKKPEFPFHPESPVILDISKGLSPVVFIHKIRETPPSTPFHSGDGFDLYIDGARFLPDAVTISRITGRILDRNYNQTGPDISTGLHLNSSIYEPFYNYHIEIRTPHMTPSATLLLKVYSVDRFTMKLALIGWAALNLFVESGTETQPSVDLGAIQISLNEGAHQLRLYSSGPDADKPLSVNAFVSAGRYIPCATLLLRLKKSQTNKKVQILESNDDFQTDQEKTRPLQPRPNYSDGVYFSDKANPTHGEKCLYSTMVNRSVILVREIVTQMAGERAQDLETDEQISDWIKKTLSRQLDAKPRPFNITYVTRYRTQYGVKFAIDCAKNLPWSSITMAHYSFNPPGAFYFGEPWLKYDRPVFTEDIDIKSYQHFPVWLDGFKSFPRRVYKEYLTMIVHLHEMMIDAGDEIPNQEKASKEKAYMQAQSKESKATTYSLGGQAWTAVGIFSMGYCKTGVYQLPLFQGTPTKSILAVLSQGECYSVIKGLMDSNSIQLVKGASVIVRIADGRRDEELQIFTNGDIDQSFLPDDVLDAYMAEPKRDIISKLLPQGRAEEEVKRHLAYKFKQLIYKTVASHSTDKFVASRMARPEESMNNNLPLMGITRHTGQKQQPQLADAQGLNQHVMSPWNDSIATARSVPEGSHYFHLPTAL